MPYETDIGNIPVIDDTNVQPLLRDTYDPTTAWTTGFETRDYTQYGLGSYAPVFSGNKIPRSQWDELIALQDKNETSPWHVHKKNNLPILNQNGIPYCWMYGTVACVMNRYAAQGLEPVPHLSATGPAAQGKSFRQQGGWAGEAVKYIAQFGIPTIQTWPEHSLDRKHINETMKADAKRHGIVEFEELPSRDFDTACSVLLNPHDPNPITLGLMWWGHLVAGLRVVKVQGQYGILIVNSWGSRWEDGGYAVLMENKATAHEYVRVKRVKPRAA